VIRFAKNADPQPLPKDLEDKSAAQIQGPPEEGDKKSGAKAARGRTPQPADDDRLI